MNQIVQKSFWKDEQGRVRLELFLIFFFAIHLIGITNAPLEVAHNWRQVTGLMVARNYFETDPTFWFPRVDHTNGATGIIGMEFPLLNYLHYLTSLLFDYNHWYGRLINLIITQIGILYFYKLIKQLFNEDTAYFSSLFILGSIWFTYERKMMSDTFCIALCFIGLYFAWKYLAKKKTASLLTAFAFLTLGCLCKIPAVICLVAIPFMSYKKSNTYHVLLLNLLTGLSILITYLWYFQWNTYLSSTYGSWYNSGGTLAQGAQEVLSHLQLTAKQFYFGSFQSYASFGLLLLSFWIVVKNKKFKLLFLFLSASILFILYMLKSGKIFYTHTYYIIPIIPFFAVFMGYTVGIIKNYKLQIAIVFICLLESIGNQQHDLFTKESELYKMTLEKRMDALSSQDELVAINGNGNPQQLYLSHRKGWVIEDKQSLNKDYIQSLVSKGCAYLIIDRKNFLEKPEYPIVFEDLNYSIYSLKGLLTLSQAKNHR